MSTLYAENGSGIPGNGKDGRGGEESFIPFLFTNEQYDLDHAPSARSASMGEMGFIRSGDGGIPARAYPPLQVLGLQQNSQPHPSTIAGTVLQRSESPKVQASGYLCTPGARPSRSCTNPPMPSWLADKNGKRHSQGTRLSWGMLGNRARDDATNSAHRFHYVQTCVVPEPLTHTGVVPPLTPLLEYHSTPQLPSSIRLAHTTDHTADQPPDLVNTPTLTSETTAWGIETPTSQRHNEADLAAAQQPSFSVHDVPGFYPSDVTGMGMEDTVGESNYGSASYHLTLPANVRKVAKAAVIEAATRRRRCKAEFQCKLGCGQTFTTRHNLNYHHKAHQGIKEHECRHSVCNAQFVTPSDRRRHEAKCPLKIIIPSAALNPAPDA